MGRRGDDGGAKRRRRFAARSTSDSSSDSSSDAIRARGITTVTNSRVFCDSIFVARSLAPPFASFAYEDATFEPRVTTSVSKHPDECAPHTIARAPDVVHRARAPDVVGVANV